MGKSASPLTGIKMETTDSQFEGKREANRFINDPFDPIKVSQDTFGSINPTVSILGGSMNLDILMERYLKRSPNPPTVPTSNERTAKPKPKPRAKVKVKSTVVANTTSSLQDQTNQEKMSAEAKNNLRMLELENELRHLRIKLELMHTSLLWERWVWGAEGSDVLDSGDLPLLSITFRSNTWSKLKLDTRKDEWKEKIISGNIEAVLFERVETLLESLDSSNREDWEDIIEGWKLKWQGLHESTQLWIEEMES
jgi:hypothetical protein